MVAEQGLFQLKIHDTVYTVGADVPPETSLNEYIRNYAYQKGTKFMCLEGGCGACIVAIKRRNPTTGQEEIFAANSCLVPIFSCYGWSIITVEGIGNKKNGYHKVQSTLAGFSGTQCGYCTPGMVMNMFSLLNAGGKVTMKDVENSFGGNICRCTGYRPILDAFKSLASDATPELKKTCTDIEDIMTQLKICSKTQQPCENLCKKNESDTCDSDRDTQIPDVSVSIQLRGAKWFRVKSVQEIYDVFETVQDNTKYMIVGGNTAHGVYRTEPQDIYIDINAVKELHDYSLSSDKLVLGANISLTRTMQIMNKVAGENPNKFGYLKQLASHIDLIANVPVRNVGTLAGNLSIKYFHREFPSDIFLILETVDAQLTIGHVSGMVYTYPLEQYLLLDMRKRVIINISFPALDSSAYVYTSYKIMQRAQNTHAYVNAGFLVKVDKSAYYRVTDSPTIVFGGINPQFVHATNTENYINGKNLLDFNTLKEACRILKSELKPDNDPTEASPEYRVLLAVSLFYKFILSLSPNTVDSKYRSGGSILTRPLSSGKQDFQTDKSIWPVTKPMPKLEAFSQCSGEAEYVNDIPSQVKEMYGAFVVAKKGPGKLTSIDTSVIKNMSDVKFISAKDIPGKNTFVEVFKVEDEQLFADKQILYAGQPVGVIVAKTQNIANKLADKIIVNVEQTYKPVLDFKVVVDSNDQNRIVKQAEKPATAEKRDIKYKFNGSLLMGGQYHYTMETQTCYCVPVEDGMDIYPATQWIAAVQQNAAVALNLPENSINISVKRCGGGYGSKLGRSALVSTACAVAASNMKVPVRMVVKLETNMEAVGKRFPMYGKYEVAINEKGEIQYLIINTYSDKGATLNESLMGQIVTHVQSCYDSSSWTITEYDVRTDHTTNTYARAPGSTEGIALIECIMDHIASVANLDPIAVRLANLNSESTSAIPPMIEDVKKNSDLVNRLKSVEEFNKVNRWKKRGISLVAMNYPYVSGVPYHIIISVYMYDGSVAITHGGIEIGQGINTKVAQAVAHALGIDINLIKIKAAMAITSPNDGPTGGSMTSDGVTYAALESCKILLQRLEPIKQKNPGKSWPELIAAAAAANVDLCCEYMYSPVEGQILQYNIFGVAVSEVEVDLLTGQYVISRVDLLEDVGQSISPDVDIGQVEGAYVMGLGYWLTEKLIYDQNTGALLTNRTWNYTPPGAKDIPVDFRVYFRRNAPNPLGVLRSKAVGEPPLCLSIGVVFAIRNALLSGRKDAGSKDNWFQINLPYTPENVLLSSMTSIDQFAL